MATSPTEQVHNSTSPRYRRISQLHTSYHTINKNSIIGYETTPCFIERTTA